jgi:protein phosphatase
VQIIWKIEEKISHLSEEMPEYAHMGTTLSVLVIFNAYALIAHVGDSRIYRFRRGEMEQLTEDETMAQLSVEMGYLRPDEVPSHPLGHVLTQALGQGIEEIHTRMEKVEPGDKFLLCSDGLYDMVPDKRIHEILHESTAAQGACERLIKEALREGGKDNITVVLVEAECGLHFKNTSFSGH